METYNADDTIDRRFENIDSTKYGEIVLGMADVHSAESKMADMEVKGREEMHDGMDVNKMAVNDGGDREEEV